MCETFYTCNHTAPQSCGSFLLNHCVYPPFAIFLSLCGKNEPSFSVVPIFYTILPRSCFFTSFVVCTELLVCNCIIKELMVLELPFGVVSNCHSMPLDDLRLLSCFGSVTTASTTLPALPALSALPALPTVPAFMR